MQYSSSNLLGGKRFVVCGEDPTRSAIYNSLAKVLGGNRLDLARNEWEVQDFLWSAGDSIQLSDTTHLVFASSSPLTAEKMFHIHYRFRPNDRKNATICGFGPGWSGGIVFIGPNTQDLNKLISMEPFNRIRAGHEVLPSSALLLNLLITIAKLKPVYPDKWKEALLSIEGLSSLKSIFRMLNGKATLSKNDLQILSDAINKLLADDLLGKLLAHQEVIGRLREIAQEIATILKDDHQNCPNDFVRKIKTTLCDYL
jgi:hypothetical protein